MKKIFKYLGAVLGCLSCLALFVAPFALVVGSNVSKSTASEEYGLFADLSGLSDLYKLAGENFQPFWVTLFQIAVIVATTIAVVMLVVYILNDLGVIKAKKVEKLLSTLLIVVGIVGLVAVALCTMLNTYTVEALTVKTTTKFIATLLGWLVPVFAIAGGIVANLCADAKTKKKK